MAFEGLSEKLGKVFKTLKGYGKLNEKTVNEAMREVKMALLEADVSYKVVKDFIKTVSERAIGAEVMESLTPAQQVIDIVHEELCKLMGETNVRLSFPSKPPCVIMMCGLQGAGKTTHAAKLAKYLKSQNRRPMLVACDIYRPAAIDQLKIVGERAGVKVFEMGREDPVRIARESVKYAKDNGFDVVLLDTAGRLHIDETLMNELKEIEREVTPNEILLVVDSMTGQDAVNVAKSFNEALEISGVVLTKLDGDTRGGAALSVLAVTGKPIKFAGTGEKIDDLEPFHPDRMANRILGMGDVLSLIEKAKDSFDEKEAEKLARKMQQNKFDMNDLLSQFEQIEKMGSISSILNMIPGISGKVKEEDIDERKMPRTKAIILSMTKKERERPSLIDAKRKRRIAAGSGTRVEDVNNLLKQFDMMQKMMKQLGGKGGKKRIPKNLLRGLGGMDGFTM
ncbi:MAG: signal recognition particle protein [Bacteroides sp.]|nr:signal recognition particle protein [Eubacterium sp.]MCM1417216.1 signal recognition particle protein [Roseburia sp.]MCM1461163.1 signal recognition particle protein [Bacteroides sp.]